MNFTNQKKPGFKQLMVFVIMLAFLSVGLVVPVASAEVGDVIYLEGFESENTLQQNGDVEITLTNAYASAGNSSLLVVPTADNNYSGVALRNSILAVPMLPGGEYKLTARVYSEKDAKVGVRVETKDSSGGDTYGSVGSAKVNLIAGQWVEVEMNFSVPEDHQSVSAIVFHNDDQIPGLNFYLDEVKLEITALPEPMGQQEITRLLDFSFEDKGSEESLFRVGTASSIEWIREAGAGKGDKTALKVTHIDGQSYTSADNAVRLTLREPLPVGGVYHISAWFYAPAKGNEDKGALTGPGVVINGEYGKNEFKLPSNFGTLPVGEWKEVSIQTPLMQTPLTSIDFRLVVNEEKNHADIWHLDNIVISQVGELEKILQPEWDLSLPSIADTYKEYFLIGNVMGADQITGADTTAMYRHHYNLVTAENDMKPQYLSPRKGVYNYTTADALVEWAERNQIKVHGHTLVWHSQSAPWLTLDADGKALTRAEAKSNMEEYINNVAGHYKGKLISWDVVNEAFDGGRDIPTEWKTVLRKNSPWYIAYENGADKSKGESGADYIYDAFVFTRLVDPEAILYYNDYNETDAWKREAIALMTEELNEKWKTDSRNTEPNRLLVERLGMQSHFWTDNLDVNDVEATILRFAKTGAEISITELDVPYGSYANQHSGPLTKEQEIQQAKLYAQLFEIYKKYASNIDRITFWGKTDPQSWRSFGSPVLFDKAFAAKPAYYAVIDPEGYLLANWINPYSDVTSTSWFYRDVAYATIHNLIDSKSETTFRPSEKVTWGQLLGMLYILDGQNGDIRNVAVDQWAIHNGLVETGFHSGSAVNRQDMAVIIEKYLQYSGKKLSLPATHHAYADDAAIDVKAKSAVKLLHNAGIMIGKADNFFEPAGFVNRAETAVIIHRVAKIGR